MGFEEGRNLVVEWRWANGVAGELPALAADLVNRRVEVIVAVLNEEILAARRATAMIPIVMVFASAPVEIGVVASLRRPGGNVTGTTWYTPQTAQRLLQFLKEAQPSARRIAVLRNPLFPGMEVYRAHFDRAARLIDVQVEYFDATDGGTLRHVLDRIAASGPDGFIFAEDPVLSPHSGEIVAFVQDRKWMSIGSSGTWVNSGGLFSFAPDRDEILKRTADLVARILRGAKPADLPVEEPTRFEFAVNLKAAKALGFKVPQSVLARADRVIE